MKFISKYRKLRVVLMPTRKIFHKEGASGDEVEIIPPVLAEFDGGMFDTKTQFENLHKIQADAGHPERLDNEEKLVHLLQGHPQFGKDYNEFYEATPEERIAQKRQELRDLEAEYGITSDEDDKGKTSDSSKEDETTQGQDDGGNKSGDADGDTTANPDTEVPSRVELEKMPYKDLQRLAGDVLGINPVGKSQVMLVDMLEEKHLEQQNGSQE